MKNENLKVNSNLSCQTNVVEYKVYISSMLKLYLTKLYLVKFQPCKTVLRVIIAPPVKATVVTVTSISMSTAAVTTARVVLSACVCVSFHNSQSSGRKKEYTGQTLKLKVSDVMTRHNNLLE